MRIVMIVLAMLGPGAALADEISGDWCGPEGRSLTILGATVVTPGGAEVPGRYSRHRYEFETPAGEPGAGDTVVINQLSEEAVDVFFGSADPVRWTRCRDVTS